MTSPHRPTSEEPAPAIPPVGLGVVAAVATVFLALPIAGLFGRVRWSTFLADLTSRDTLDALRLSLTCSLGATALSLLLGIPLAWVLARVPFRGRSLVRGLVLLPLVLPPVVGGAALLAAFGRSGLVGGRLHDLFGVQLTFTTAGVILAETFVALPFLVLTVEAGLRSVDPRLEEAAAGLGASPATTFRRVTLPLAAPSIAAGAVLAWARALGEFGATITFAGNVATRTRTLPLAVYLDLDTRPERAWALSLVLLAVSLAVIVLQRSRWLAGLVAARR